MKKNPIILAAALLATAVLPATAADLVVADWGGDYVSANQNFGRAQTTLATDYALGVGATKQIAWSESTLLKPTASYAAPVGKIANFYGGMFSSASGTGLGFQTFTTSVTNNTTADRLNYRSQLNASTGLTGRSGAFGIAFLKADFLNGATVNPVTLGAGSSLSMNITGISSPMVARFMVKNGSQWYVSNTSYATTGIKTLNSASAVTLENETWATFDPATSLAFNNVTFSTVAFTDITAVGCYAQYTLAPTTDVTAKDFSVSSFTANLVNTPVEFNNPPTISNITDQTIFQDTNTGALAFTVGDDLTAVGALTLSAASTDETLVPLANIVFGGSGANRTVTATPAAGLTGSATITVTVSDGTHTTPDSFLLTVNATPVATALVVSPSAAGVAISGIQQFTAALYDQYSQLIAPQPTFAWSVSGGGGIDSNGLFTAGATPGSFTVTANAASLSGTAACAVLLPASNVPVGTFYTINGGALNATNVDTVGTNMTASASNAYDGALAQLSSPVTLASEGDRLTLTFLTESMATNNNDTWNFRFGMFNTNANPVTANDQIAASDLWTGYFAMRHTSQSASSNENGGTADLYRNSIFKQGVGSSPLLMEGLGGLFGASPAGIAADVIQLITSADGNDAVGGADGSDGDFRQSNLPISVTLILERVAAGGLKVTTTPRFSNGNTGSFTATDLTPITYTFDSIAFGNIGNFRVDDVVVTANVSGSGNTAPTISAIANQSIGANAATSALAITIGDGETAAGSLTLTGGSSNLTLVPNANIVFGGSGAARTVTVTPAANQTGTATITVTVSDGSLTAPSVFTLTVTPNYSSWISGYPVGGLNAPGDDADLDGLTNLLEYALDSNPSTSSTAPAAQIVNVSGQNYLQIQWTRPNDRAGISTVGQVSAALATWSSAIGDVTTTIAPAAPGFETVTIRDVSPLTANSRHFLRAQVVQSP
jgi:hypothetical protein